MNIDLIFAGRIIVEVSRAQPDIEVETVFLKPRMIRQAHQDCANEYRFLLLAVAYFGFRRLNRM